MQNKNLYLTVKKNLVPNYAKLNYIVFKNKLRIGILFLNLDYERSTRVRKNGRRLTLLQDIVNHLQYKYCAFIETTKCDRKLLVDCIIVLFFFWTISALCFKNNVFNNT